MRPSPATRILAFALLTWTSAFATTDAATAYQPRIDADGWEVLFDGKNLDAWDYEPASSVWEITPQGELHPIKPKPDLTSKRRYCDFALELDFKMAAKQQSNSGVFFRVHDPKDPINTGMQMQILDNADYNVPFDALNANGALYGLVRPAVDANVPIGQWNHARIMANDHNIVLELNGKRVVNADLNTWTTSSGKTLYPLGLLPREGFIVLENYGAVPMWFRNIRIKPLTNRKPQHSGKEPIGNVLRKLQSDTRGANATRGTKAEGE